MCFMIWFAAEPKGTYSFFYNRWESLFVVATINLNFYEISLPPRLFLVI